MTGPKIKGFFFEFLVWEVETEERKHCFNESSLVETSLVEKRNKRGMGIK
jgi:hypothetical protein